MKLLEILFPHRRLQAHLDQQERRIAELQQALVEVREIASRLEESLRPALPARLVESLDATRLGDGYHELMAIGLFKADHPGHILFTNGLAVHLTYTTKRYMDVGMLKDLHLFDTYEDAANHCLQAITQAGSGWSSEVIKVGVKVNGASAILEMLK